MLVSVVCFALLARSPAVSFSMPPTRLVRLLPKLSESYGLELTAEGEIKDDVLVVSVRDVSPDEMLKRIEAATGGAWRKTEKGYVLELTKERRDVQAASELAEDVRVLKAAMEAFCKEPNPMRAGDPDFDEPPRMMMGVGSRSPVGGPVVHKALQDLARLLDPEDLARARDQEIVYSLTPTKMQRRLPEGSAAILAAAIAEESKRLAAGPVRGRTISGHVLPSVWDPKTARVALVVSGTDFPNYKLHLRLADKEGMVVSASDKQLIAVPDKAREAQAGRLLKDEGLQKPLELEEDAKAAFDLFEQMAAKDFTMVRTPEAVKGRMANPVQNDPLAFSIAGIFQTVGERFGRNVIAVVPDSLSEFTLRYAPSRMALYGTGNPIFASVLSDLAKDPMRIEMDGNWLVGRPERPLAERAARADRNRLAALFGTIANRKLPSFDAILSAMGSGRTTVEPFRSLAGFIHPPFHPYNAYDQPHALQIYALLTPAQRTNLDRGVRFGDLPLAVQNLISFQALRSTFSPVSVEDPKVERAPEGFTLVMARGQAEWVEAMPTVAIPNGIPPGAVLTGELEIREEKVPLGWREVPNDRFGKVTEATGWDKCRRVGLDLRLQVSPTVKLWWMSNFKAG